jgi:hypothetical protein
MQDDLRRVRRADPLTRAVDGEARPAQSGMDGGAVELELVRKRPGPRLAVAVVLVVAVVGLGVAGRLLPAGESGPEGASPRLGPTAVTQPAVAVLKAGEETGSGAENVVVRLSALRPIGLVRVSIDLGGLVLGSTVTSITTSGAIKVAFPILRPEVAMEAEVQVATYPAGERELRSRPWHLPR